MVTPSIEVTHTFTCPNGQAQTVTRVIPIPVQGIFIGRRGQISNLSEYECVLPGSAYAGNLPVYMSGRITVNKKVFTFWGSQIFVEPGDVGFDVPSGRGLQLKQNGQGIRTVMRGAIDCNCLWRGNEANAGTIIMDGATLEDALFAANAFKGSTLSVNNTQFNKNFIGIRATDGAFALSKFEQNDFSGTGAVRNACELLPRTLQIISAKGSPVTFSTERGYAGMYLNSIGSLNLLGLKPLNRQNLFHDLAEGIQAFDTDLRIESNCRFYNIQAGRYGQITPGAGAAGIRFIDTPIAGSNACKVIGNAPVVAPFPVSDFGDCAIGVHITSSVQGDGASGTRIQISNCLMSGMQHGIHLVTGLLSGTLAGGGNGSFRGIFQNDITSDHVWGGAFDGNVRGVVIEEQSPTISSLQVYRNSIRVSSPANSGSGIVILGNSQNTQSVAPQIDIHRNRIIIEDSASTGIAAFNYFGVWIHDNSEDGASGAGIFMNNQTDFGFAGIALVAGAENVIACNDIISSGTQGNIWGLLWSTAHVDGMIARNHFVSAGPALTGVVWFTGINGMATNFLRNTIEGSSGNGLTYATGAQTGPQGSPFPNYATNGNRWLGSFNNGANSQSNTPPGNSRFHVRGNIPDESPTTNTPLWFINTVPFNIQPPAFACPLTAPLPPPPASPNDGEIAIADSTIQYDYHPAAYTWWNEHNLYRKLLRYPELRQGNTLMQSFFNAKSSTPSAQLVNAVSASDSLFAVSSAQQSSILSLQSGMDVLGSQIALLDSTMNQTADSSVLAGFAAQRGQKMDSLIAEQTAAQAVFLQLGQQRVSAAPAVLASITAITSTNAFEANLKKVLYIYVRFAALGIEPSAADLSDLSSIGGQCPFVAGPAKYIAYTLYLRFTGIDLPETPCPPNLVDPNSEDRSQQRQADMGFMLLPNPASDRLEVRYDAPGLAWLSIQNGLGQQVLRALMQTSGQGVDISALAPGCYFARLEQDGKPPLAQPLIIHR